MIWIVCFIYVFRGTLLGLLGDVTEGRRFCMMKGVVYRLNVLETVFNFSNENIVRSYRSV